MPSPPCLYCFDQLENREMKNNFLCFFLQKDRAKLKRHPSLFSRKLKSKTINGDLTNQNGNENIQHDETSN